MIAHVSTHNVDAIDFDGLVARPEDDSKVASVQAGTDDTFGHLIGLDNFLIRSICTAPQPPGRPSYLSGFKGPSISARNVGCGGRSSVNGSSLSRRVMNTPSDSSVSTMDNFMRRELQNAIPVVWVNRLGNDQNTAVFLPLKLEAISLGTTRLSGCTSMVIVSRTGVYFTHWWENLTFDLEDTDKLKGKGKKALLDRAINPLKQGGSTSLPSLTGKADFFKDDSVRAFLIRPFAGAQQNPDPYREDWDAIKTTVAGIIPALDLSTHADRWKEVTYDALNNFSPKLDNTAHGRLLVKYDPDHPADTGGKKLTIWSEYNQIYNDQWS